ncbi:MAG: A/G-specific adenine glycosylase [Treponema sp.]|nr:A/G-specific adenine glycosylase [Treponema sp.]
MKIKLFQEMILCHYMKEGRNFPWRGANPWGVMVSEFMLQQTQTERVIPYWEKWMALWPQPKNLAAASMEDVMREWVGLGYNTRCSNLKKSACIIAKDYGGMVPDNQKSLLLLPGIGPYIAGAIACFGFNRPAVFLETNIRSVIIHSFFPERDDVRDAEIYPILKKILYKEDPRKWYYALMDYGVYLKKTVDNPNRRSAHYKKQSPFIGSFRQARGRVIKSLVSMGPSNVNEIMITSGMATEKLYRVLEKLKSESMVAEENGIYRIND